VEDIVENLASLLEAWREEMRGGERERKERQKERERKERPLSSRGVTDSRT